VEFGRRAVLQTLEPIVKVWTFAGLTYRNAGTSARGVAEEGFCPNAVLFGLINYAIIANVISLTSLCEVCHFLDLQRLVTQFSPPAHFGGFGIITLF